MLSAVATDARLVLTWLDCTWPALDLGACILRTANEGENMAVIRHMAINMLNKAKKLFKNISLKALHNKAGWENDTLSLILGQRC